MRAILWVPNQTKIKYKNTSTKVENLRDKFSKMMVKAENEDFDEELFTNTLKDYIKSLTTPEGTGSKKKRSDKEILLK